MWLSDRELVPDVVSMIVSVDGTVAHHEHHPLRRFDLGNRVTIGGYDIRVEDCFIARRRHLDALARAKQALLTGQQQLIQHRAGELLAEDLTQAQRALGEITGEFHSDELLGKIFGEFCIGK